MLLTPAPFIDGWKPGWLTFSNSAEAFKGRHPAPAGSNMPELRLRAAAVPRFQTISGWGLAPDAKTGYDRPGPKPIRRLVPAGAVYFVDFPAAEADPASVARAFWLSSMADTEADRRDGFGLILAGTW